jgi:bacterioferritin-associated ferredoxin
MAFCREAGLLLDVAALNFACAEVSDRLLDEKVAATPMRGWSGEIADRDVRLVFSNETVERLAAMGDASQCGSCGSRLMSLMRRSRARQLRTPVGLLTSEPWQPMRRRSAPFRATPASVVRAPSSPGRPR